MEKNESALEITDKEFDEIIANGHKLVLVDFFAEWCMPCLMLSPVIEELAEEIKEVKFVKVNVDDNKILAGKYGISSIPCMILFKDGKEVDRLIGNQTAEDIESKIRGYLG
ncbi:thioredoxin [Candidatus Pacearchaeota archaeon]|nr:thioredoxin [Candidatus Pacearchaeota archaeon]